MKEIVMMVSKKGKRRERGLIPILIRNFPKIKNLEIIIGRTIFKNFTKKLILMAMRSYN